MFYCAQCRMQVADIEAHRSLDHGASEHDWAELRRAIRDAARRQGVGEREVARQLVDVCDTNGYVGTSALLTT